MENSQVVRQAEPDDAEVVATTLADAFADDPVNRWMLGDRRDPSKLVHLYRSIVSMGLRRDDHEIWMSDGGAALWYPPARWKATPGETLRVLPGVVRSFGLGNLRALRLLQALEAAHPKEHHYYLEILGVRRDRQGSGVGSALLADMTARCDAEGLPAYLESSNPRNEPLYARYGFVVSGELQVPSGCPPLTPMWREPRS